MMHRTLIALLVLLRCVGANAQHRTLIDMELGSFLRTADPATQVDLFLQGPAERVARIAESHGGTVKMSMRNWCAVRMPAGRIAELDNEPLVRSIEFKRSRGHTMNDSMRAKTHIDWIQQGLAPLPQAYDGTGVVMGIVDTGIDFMHPDLRDSITGTRVIDYWDQRYAFSGANTPMPYGYGQHWTKTQIDAGQCPTTDYDSGGHGTTVAGTASGNGQASGYFVGAAPKSDLVVVATNFNAPNWSATVADAVKYTFDKADALGEPAVVNLSIGDYLGSHDGLDPAALLIDSMLNAAPGRAVVAAAGNSGCISNYQLHMAPDGDTTFAWITTNPNSFIGQPAAYVDFWADTAQMNDVYYSIGADRVAGGFAYRGRIPFRNVQGTVSTYVDDDLISTDGNLLGHVTTYASLRGGQYHLEIAIINPDSASYYWRIMMTGNGVCDAWSNHIFQTSDILSLNLPTPAEYPPMANYVFPTVDRGIVDSWACSPHVITVANYCNEVAYTACNATAQTVPGTEGDIANCSSHGPSRTGLVKPDIAAPGDVTFSAAPLSIIQSFQNGAGVFKLSWDCMHVRNGGTSIASPAVAGAAALFLQKCPLASHTTIMEAITGTAVADGFTGAVPNYRFGHGKLDAFAAMVTTNFEAHITGAQDVCPGDSVPLTAVPEGASYVWNGTASDQVTWYATGGPVTLHVIDAQGCASSPQDSVFINTYPAPTVPSIIQNDADLTCAITADQYTWFWNGAEIAGANGQTFTAEHTGEYTVMATDTNGCSATSAPVYVAIAGINEANAPADLVLWPSPAHGLLHVTCTAAAAVAFEVQDVRGAVVARGTLAAKSTTDVPLTGLAPGTYVLRAIPSGKEVRRRFVVR